MENGTSILFGLPGVAVRRVERALDERGVAVRLVHVVTNASSAAGCPQCGVVSTSVKQRRTTRPRATAPGRLAVDSARIDQKRALADRLPARGLPRYSLSTRLRMDPGRLATWPGRLAADARICRITGSAAARCYRLALDNVMDYRFVKDHPAKTGVKSSQSGNSSH